MFRDEKIREELAKIQKKRDELHQRYRGEKPHSPLLAEVRMMQATLDRNEKKLRQDLNEIVPPRDTTKGVNRTCPIHKAEMRVRRVPIVYGLLASDSPPEIKQRVFPYARSWWWGGCVITPHAPDEAIIYVCPACQRAEKRWMATHEVR